MSENKPSELAMVHHYPVCYTSIHVYCQANGNTLHSSSMLRQIYPVQQKKKSCQYQSRVKIDGPRWPKMVREPLSATDLPPLVLQPQCWAQEELALTRTRDGHRKHSPHPHLVTLLAVIRHQFRYNHYR